MSEVVTPLPPLFTFKAEFRRKGHLRSDFIYQRGESEAHAAELIREKLTRQFGEGRFFVSEAVRISDKELPDSEAVFAELAKQSRQLRPPVPSGPLFVFKLRTAGGGEHRLTIFQADENRDAARAKAERYLLESPPAKPTPELLPGVRQYGLSDYVSRFVRGEGEIFSALRQDDAVELAIVLKAGYQQRCLAFLAKELERVERGELPDWPTGRMVSYPPPSTLQQAALHYLQEFAARRVREREETAELAGV